VSKVNFTYPIVLLLAISVSSCSMLRIDTECKLIPEHNEIIGKDKNAPTLEIKSLYLILLLGDLFGESKSKISEAHDHGYNWLTPPIFAGFKISGCSDTTRAKLIMANHLLNKYNIVRKDSVYLDTIYKIEIVDFNKLPINDDCSSNHIFKYTKDSTEIYSTRTCLEWDSFFINIIDHLCIRHHCKSLDIPIGNEKMDMIIPVRMKVNHDIEGMLKYYEETFGVRATQERIDSIPLTLFKSLSEMN